MRPVALTLQAFGSYPGRETVDFADLAHLGLFVVTGPTGSGKTTLFDALSFALYGVVPGDRPDGDVRSHHADDGVLTEVTLEFDVDGRRHRVFRRPRQMRPKRSGTGWTEMAAEAELHRLGPVGWEPVETSVIRVGQACADLVGLRPDQFQKVVLLPQGRFAEFLLAGNREREQLLRQLFGTAHVERATRTLVDRARQLQDEVGALETEIDHHRRSALVAACQAHDTLVLETGPLVRATASSAPTVPPVQHSLFDTPEILAIGAAGADDADRADEQPALPDDASSADIALVLDRLAEGTDTLRAMAVHATTRAATARDDAAQAEDAARRVDQNAEATATWTRLVAAQPDIERADLAADAGRRARPVVAADTDLGRLTLELDAARRSVVDLHARVGDLLVGVGSAPVATVDDAVRAVAALSGEIDAAQALVAALQTAATACDAAAREHDDAAATVDALTARLDEVVAVRADLVAEVERLTPVADQVGPLSAEADRARGLVIAAERRDAAARSLTEALDAAERAERHENELLRVFAAAAAPRLAARLVDGEPCLVCGSLDHPRPAVGQDDGAHVDEAALDAARRATVRAHAHRTEQATALRLARDDMGEDAEAVLADLRAARSAVEARLSEAVAAGRRATALREQIAGLDEIVEEARREQAAATARVASTRARVDLLVAQYAAAEEAAAGLDVATLDRRAADIPRIEHACRAWREAVAACERRAGEHGRAVEILTEALATSGFPDVEHAHAAFVSDDEQARLERRVATWKSEREAVRAILDLLADQGVPHERPDTDLCARRRAEAEAEAARVAAALAAVETSLLSARRSLTAATDLAGGSAELRADAALTARVAAVCNGQVAPRISLETWVLSRELERVAQAANVHLERMTSGRYTLRTLDTVTEFDQRRRAGLDLVVFDAHTGRERSPRTLSGGEQFQAALALALGLADVVSRGGAGNGKVFEALFVDEGFGSLDPDALDHAIDALSHLQAGGRMVGVITHVEAMKNQLPTGVRVERRPDGRGSRLAVA